MRRMILIGLVCLLCGTATAKESFLKFRKTTTDDIAMLKAENAELKTRIEAMKAELAELKKQITSILATAKKPGTTKAKPAKKKYRLKPAAVDKPAPLEVIDVRYTTCETAIYAGPGTGYRKDLSGNLEKGEVIYVVKDVGDWIRFRVTGKDVGWHAWVQKSKTVGRLQMWVSEGILESVNVDYNEARVDPLKWCSYSLEIKRNIVINLSQHFDLMGSTARVTILSSRNDKKLATFSSWTGIKILE